MAKGKRTVFTETVRAMADMASDKKVDERTRVEAAGIVIDAHTTLLSFKAGRAFLERQRKQGR